VLWTYREQRSSPLQEQTGESAEVVADQGGLHAALDTTPELETASLFEQVRRDPVSV
jgi:hypothetical protein